MILLRDQFAAAALEGLLASEAQDQSGAIDATKLFRDPQLYARLAYELADAMMVARCRPKLEDESCRG